MKVIKVLNNSLVLSHNNDDTEVIIMGKGIGFSSKEGDDIDVDKVEKVFTLQQKAENNQYLRVIEQAPAEIMELVRLIFIESEERFNLRLNEQLFFTLVEHLRFAIERHHKGIVLQSRMLHEVKRFHPQEFMVAQRVVEQAKVLLNVSLPEEEAGNIAFHLVNGQTDAQNMEHTMLAVKMLKDIFNLIQYFYRITIDTDSLNYTRFFVHMQFFIQRMIESEQICSRDEVLYQMMKNEYPQAHQCALLIRDYVKKLIDADMSNDELLYLMVHLIRLRDNERID